MTFKQKYVDMPRLIETHTTVLLLAKNLFKFKIFMYCIQHVLSFYKNSTKRKNRHYHRDQENAPEMSDKHKGHNTMGERVFFARGTSGIKFILNVTSFD